MTEEINEEEFNEEEFVLALDQRIIGLKEQNQLMIGEIQATGANIDIGAARLERFVLFLVDNGGFTTLQRLAEQEQWELHLRQQLQSIIAQVRQAATATGKDVKTGTGIILPGKK